MILAHNGEYLERKYKIVKEWGLNPDSTLANVCQTRLRSDCGAVHVCLHCCCRSMIRSYSS